jgi:hypothetical protein
LLIILAVQFHDSGIAHQMEGCSGAKEAVRKEVAKQGRLKMMVADLHIYA